MMLHASTVNGEGGHKRASFQVGHEERKKEIETNERENFTVIIVSNKYPERRQTQLCFMKEPREERRDKGIENRVFVIMMKVSFTPSTSVTCHVSSQNAQDRSQWNCIIPCSQNQLYFCDEVRYIPTYEHTGAENITVLNPNLPWCQALAPLKTQAIDNLHQWPSRSKLLNSGQMPGLSTF